MGIAADMISPSVLRAAPAIQARFQSAVPFKHVCIDDFFVDSFAEQALADFPAFDRCKAINEYGEVGRKAVHSNLADISPFYKTLYDWLFSQEFLGAMSEITGIPDLIGDPTLYGGGTHENLHGQALDPHVDYNYVVGGQAHRRVNLLVYLNKGWDSAWGGDIELHANPRDPATNEITSFNVSFNRAVLFETNEYSWHGFPRIDLPEQEREVRSRKCLSVYLYTRTRPQSEIAGPHGTFYVSRPLPSRIKEGLRLTEADAHEIASAIRARDMTIELYQKLEERLGRDIASLQSYVRVLSDSVKLPLIGFARQIGRVSGAFWHDGWISGDCAFELLAVSDLARIDLVGYAPHVAKMLGLTVELQIDDGPWSGTAVTSPLFDVTLPVSIAAGAKFHLRFRSSLTYNAKTLAEGDDDRDLAFIVSSLTCVP